MTFHFVHLLLFHFSSSFYLSSFFSCPSSSFFFHKNQFRQPSTVEQNTFRLFPFTNFSKLIWRLIFSEYTANYQKVLRLWWSSSALNGILSQHLKPPIPETEIFKTERNFFQVIILKIKLRQHFLNIPRRKIENLSNHLQQVNT